MRPVFISILSFGVTVVLLAWFLVSGASSDIETKGPAEITEWIKLAVALVTLLIGIINLRIALTKNKE